MCKVYTDVGGINSYTMFIPLVARYPLAKARGLSPRTCGQPMVLLLRKLYICTKSLLLSPLSIDNRQPF